MFVFRNPPGIHLESTFWKVAKIVGKSSTSEKHFVGGFRSDSYDLDKYLAIFNGLWATWNPPSKCFSDVLDLPIILATFQMVDSRWIPGGFLKTNIDGSHGIKFNLYNSYNIFNILIFTSVVIPKVSSLVSLKNFIGFHPSVSRLVYLR